jgi:hypothetical protein
VLGDDVDDAVYSVCTPDGATGTAYDLDAVDVVEQDVLNIPIDALEEFRVYTSAVDEHQDVL